MAPPGYYVRWRTRMVRASVMNDMKATLLDTDWIGSTPLGLITTPVIILDGMPNANDRSISENTLAMDNGIAGDQLEAELGGALYERQYQFSIMFFAESDAVGHSLLSDLGDRYLGNTASPFVPLYDWAAATPVYICEMDVESFDYARAPEDLAPYDQHLFLAELIVTDYVEN